MTAADGMISRLMKGSVDRALRMQPRRAGAVRDEMLYAAPSARELVAEIANAGARLVEAGLSPRVGGVIVVRKSEGSGTRTLADADLGSIDNRSLETVSLGSGDPVLSSLEHGDAVIKAWPPELLAVGSDLEIVPSMALMVPDISTEFGPDRIVILPDGVCIGIGPSVGKVIGWLESANHAARIQLRRMP